MSEITYTIQYQYGPYSGQRKITLDSNDQRDPRAVMWARMQRAGELTLPMAHQSARVVEMQANEDDDGDSDWEYEAEDDSYGTAKWT